MAKGDKFYFENISECADACEHVSECVSPIIMKNS